MDTVSETTGALSQIRALTPERDLAVDFRPTLLSTCTQIPDYIFVSRVRDGYPHTKGALRDVACKRGSASWHLRPAITSRKKAQGHQH